MLTAFPVILQYHKDLLAKLVYEKILNPVKMKVQKMIFGLLNLKVNYEANRFFRLEAYLTAVKTFYRRRHNPQPRHNIKQFA